MGNYCIHFIYIYYIYLAWLRHLIYIFTSKVTMNSKLMILIFLLNILIINNQFLSLQ